MSKTIMKPNHIIWVNSKGKFLTRTNGEDDFISH